MSRFLKESRLCRRRRCSFLPSSAGQNKVQTLSKKSFIQSFKGPSEFKSLLWNKTLPRFFLPWEKKLLNFWSFVFRWQQKSCFNWEEQSSAELKLSKKIKFRHNFTTFGQKMSWQREVGQPFYLDDEILESETWRNVTEWVGWWKIHEVLEKFRTVFLLYRF